jgi:hypothetical protein
LNRELCQIREISEAGQKTQNFNHGLSRQSVTQAEWTQMIRSVSCHWSLACRVESRNAGEDWSLVICHLPARAIRSSLGWRRHSFSAAMILCQEPPEYFARPRNLADALKRMLDTRLAAGIEAGGLP